MQSSLSKSVLHISWPALNTYWSPRCNKHFHLLCVKPSFFIGIFCQPADNFHFLVGFLQKKTGAAATPPLSYSTQQTEDIKPFVNNFQDDHHYQPSYAHAGQIIMMKTKKKCGSENQRLSVHIKKIQQNQRKVPMCDLFQMLHNSSPMICDMVNDHLIPCD